MVLIDHLDGTIGNMLEIEIEVCIDLQDLLLVI